MTSPSTPSSATQTNPLLSYRPSARGTARLALNIRPDFAGWSPSARAELKIRGRRPSYLCRIDVCAVAAIFFAILTLLMFTAPSYHDLPDHAVDLFHARNPSPLLQARREDALQVSVSRAGNIYFGYQKVVPGALREVFTSGVQNGSERRVYLLVDERARYADVLPVLQAVRDAGIQNVSFWAWKKEQRLQEVPPSP